MLEILRRELIYFWYYFDIQLRQIAGYWVLCEIWNALTFRNFDMAAR
jgi:hypothetical protein